MAITESKYKFLDIWGKWNAPSKEQKEIIASTANEYAGQQQEWT